MNSIKEKLQLIPWPSKVKFTGQDYTWKPGNRLMLASESADSDLDALTVLATEMEQESLPRPIIDRTWPGQSRRRGLYLTYTDCKNCSPEGYKIKVTSAGIEAEAATAAGMFYAVQTLRQIARCCGRRWPGLEIEDAPRAQHRGIWLIAAQDVYPRMDFLTDLIKKMAAFKMNFLQVYIEGEFEFASHPDICADTFRFKPEDFLKLDELCAGHHIDLQPSFNCLGHARILGNHRYSHLAETKGGGSFCPTDPRTYKLFTELYADYLPLFRSKYFCVGGDEVGDLGMGHSYETARRRGKAVLYVNHMKKLRQLAERYGKRIQIFGDMLRAHPEILDLLPKDIILINWSYENLGLEKPPWVFDTTRLFHEKGFETWCMPGAGNWHSTMARHFSSARNIRAHAQAMARYGATGMLTADNTTVYPPCVAGAGFHGHALCAAESWSPEALNEKEFDSAFGLHALGNRTGRAVQAIRTIGRYIDCEEPSETTRAFSYPKGILLAEPFPALPPALKLNPSKDYFDRMVSGIQQAVQDLKEINDPLLRLIYTTAAHTTLLGARKARLDAAFYETATHMPVNRIRREASRLAADMTRGMAEIEQGWLATNTCHGWHDSKALLQKIIRSLSQDKVNQALAQRKIEPDYESLKKAVIPHKSSGQWRRLVDILPLNIAAFKTQPVKNLEFSICYNQDALFVKCRRESDSATDYFEIFLASDPARPYCAAQLGFDTNGSVTLKIGSLFNGLKIQSTRKGNLNIVTLVIPWNGLGARPRRGNTWRANFTYTNPSANQWFTWARMEQGFLEMHNLGLVTFD